MVKSGRRCCSPTINIIAKQHNIKKLGDYYDCIITTKSNFFLSKVPLSFNHLRVVKWKPCKGLEIEHVQIIQFPPFCILTTKQY